MLFCHKIHYILWFYRFLINQQNVIILCQIAYFLTKIWYLSVFISDLSNVLTWFGENWQCCLWTQCKLRGFQVLSKKNWRNIPKLYGCIYDDNFTAAWTNVNSFLWLETVGAGGWWMSQRRTFSHYCIIGFLSQHQYLIYFLNHNHKLSF